MADEDKSKRGIDLIQVGGLLVAVIAVLVTILFSVRAERTKEITVNYLSKRSLLSLESGRPSAALEVRLGGSAVEAPWLLSVRIQNTGNQPIEERDIEAPPKISFSKGKVLRADVTKKNPPSTFGHASVDGNVVTVHHKLLNPGDTIDFDVLLDGEPDIPSATARISGISQPEQLVLASEKVQAYPAVVQLPTPVIYLLLASGSLVGVVVMVVGLGLIGSSIIAIFRKPSVPTKDQLVRRRLRIDSVLSTITPHSKTGKVIAAALGEPIRLEWA